MTLCFGLFLIGCVLSRAKKTLKIEERLSFQLQPSLRYKYIKKLRGLAGKAPKFDIGDTYSCLFFHCHVRFPACKLILLAIPIRSVYIYLHLLSIQAKRRQIYHGSKKNKDMSILLMEEILHHMYETL